MKALVCEMCGSNEILKQDGLYVCQSCGTKYSPEDAKKLFIELTGKVDISGSTVKIDNSDTVNNYYVLARRAVKEEDYKKAAEYYKKLATERPNDWEASFYSVYCPAYGFEVDEIEQHANNITSRLPSVMSLIKNYVKEDEWQASYSEVAQKVSQLREEMYKSAKDLYFHEADCSVEFFKKQCFYIYQMEAELAVNLWESFEDKNLAIEHLRVCNTEESNISRESIFGIMEQIAPEIVNEEKKKYEQEKNQMAAERKRKIVLSFISIILGVLFFVVGFILNSMLGHVIFFMLGLIVVVIGLFSLAHYLINK